MTSKLLVFGAGIVALIAAMAGIFLYTSIPTRMGFWRLLASHYPYFIGYTPAFHYGIPWKYTWEEFYQQDLTGKRAIVTGANSGIGYDLSEALAKVGADVVMVCRSEDKCQTAKDKILGQNPRGRISTMTMDAASFASVREFGETYFQTQQLIDMLFLNAGTNFLPEPGKHRECKKTEKDGIDFLFQVNYLSHHLLYRLLEPLLAKNAKVIQTSSCISFSTFSYKVATDLDTLLQGCGKNQWNLLLGDNYAYGQSKLAQIVWVKALTRRLGSSSSISANAFHPGVVSTPLFDKVMDSGKVEDFRRDAVYGLMKSLWQSPDGALTGLFLAVTDGIKGRYFHPQAQEVVNPLSLDEQLQDDLWAFSEKLVEHYLSPLELSKSSQEQPGVSNPVQHHEKQEATTELDLTKVEGGAEEFDPNPHGATEDSISTAPEETFQNELRRHWWLPIDFRETRRWPVLCP